VVFDKAWGTELLKSRLFAYEAARWEAEGRPASRVLRDEVLQRALEWSDHQTDLSLGEAAFLDASLRVAREEQSRIAAARSRLVALLGVIVAMLVAALLYGRKLVEQREREALAARQASNDATLARKDALMATMIAEAREIVALSVTREGRTRAAALAVRALSRWSACELRQNGAYDLLVESWMRRFPELYAMRAEQAEFSTLAVSPDRSTVAVGDLQGPVHLWNLRDSSALASFMRHEGAVTSLRFSPDGRSLVSCSSDGDVRVWAIEQKHLSAALSPHTGAVVWADFVDEGRAVVTAGVDRSVRLTRLATPGVSVELARHQNAVRVALLSPARSTVASLGADGVVLLTPIAGGASRMLALPPLDDAASRRSRDWRVASFSLDGARLAAGDSSGNVLVWNTHDGALVVGHAKHEAAVTALTFSNDGSRVVSGSADKTAAVWSAETGEHIAHFQSHDGPVHAVAFTPDGHRVLSVSADRTAALWDAHSARTFVTYRGHGRAVIDGVVLDHERALTMSTDGSLRVWRLEQPRVTLADESTSFRDAVFFNDGTRLLSVYADHTLHLHDTHSGAELLSVGSHTAVVRAVALSRDEATIWSAGADNAAIAWNPVTSLPRSAHVLPSSSSIDGTAFAPDATLLAIAADDGTVLARSLLRDTQQVLPLPPSGGGLRLSVARGGGAVFASDTSGASVLWTLDAHTTRTNLHVTARTTGQVFSDDGESLIVARPDGVVSVWRVSTQREVAHTQCPAAPSTLAISHDGRFALFGDARGNVRLWRVGATQPRALDVGAGGLVAAAFTRDGRRAATLTTHARLCLWNVEDQERLVCLVTDEPEHARVMFSPAGDRVLVLDAQGGARVWNLSILDHMIETWCSEIALPGAARRVEPSLAREVLPRCRLPFAQDLAMEPPPPTTRRECPRSSTSPQGT
jgi:WD40 repeat protein